MVSDNLPHKLGGPVAWREDFGRRFAITIDTEEEFDWGAPFGRSGHTTVTVPKLRRFQQFAKKFGIKPIYFVDYSITENEEAVVFLREAVAKDMISVGVHLHPWVNPPFEERVNERNSFAGNLSGELEEKKILAMREAIIAKIGVTPRIYRAGRYGIGPRTSEILLKHGFVMDSSIRSRFDYSDEGGPDFKNIGPEPFWWDANRSLLEVPLTSIYSGMFRKQSHVLAPIMNRAAAAKALMSRMGILERIPLTPEGISVRETKEAIDVALDDDLRLLVFSFHSPSLSPGHTPYVRTSADLDRFYDWWREIFAYLEMRKVAPAGIDDIFAGAGIVS